MSVMSEYYVPLSLAKKHTGPSIVSVCLDDPQYHGDSFRSIMAAVKQCMEAHGRSLRDIHLFVPWEIKEHHFFAKGEASPKTAAENQFSTWLALHRDIIKECGALLTADDVWDEACQNPMEPFQSCSGDCLQPARNFLAKNKRLRKGVRSLGKNILRNKYNIVGENSSDGLKLDAMVEYNLVTGTLLHILSNHHQQYMYEFYASTRRPTFMKAFCKAHKQRHILKLVPVLPVKPKALQPQHRIEDLVVPKDQSVHDEQGLFSFLDLVKDLGSPYGLMTLFVVGLGVVGMYGFLYWIWLQRHGHCTTGDLLQI